MEMKSELRSYKRGGDGGSGVFQYAGQVLTFVSATCMYVQGRSERIREDLRFYAAEGARYRRWFYRSQQCVDPWATCIGTDTDYLLVV